MQPLVNGKLRSSSSESLPVNAPMYLCGALMPEFGVLTTVSRYNLSIFLIAVTEGLFLKRNGISPYEGDVFHQV